MHFIPEIITNILLFIVLYFEVFILLTYLETREKRNLPPTLLPKQLPSVSIIVPVWNEEATILKTIFSLLKLNYPKDKLSIFIVDDGSLDNTWKVLQRFSRNSQIKLLKKENGGKHTALNYALEFIESDLVGCLDADSFVHPEALKKIVAHFENDKELFAVTPSIKVHNPKKIIELMQRVEYQWAVLLRNILSYMNALYVTPGPFTIFKRNVFKMLGNYKHAYLTEDMEMAMRMQNSGLRIGNAPDAFVYTVTPQTIRSLYKQRLRWTYGFLRNVIDYKHLFFNRQYGHLGMLVLPTASISLVSTVYLVVNTISSWTKSLFTSISQIQTVGFHFAWPQFDFFYFDTSIIFFLGAVTFIGTFALVIFARKLSENKITLSLDLVYFFILYAFISPVWITKAIFNVAFARKTKWR